MSFDPGSSIQDYLVFGEYGDVNPSITDSSTYTFLNPKTMEEVFQHEIEGCFLYSRHWNPSNRYLAKALARMEDSEFAHVTASGMSAISVVVMQLCQAGDEIVSSRTIYGGTYALFKNFLPKFGIDTRFVNITDLAAVEAAITEKTKILYCESISNPLLEVADIPALSKIARQHNVTLVVDNTFSPMIISPIRLGADIVVHSMTKFINGTSDCVAGCICGSEAFIQSISDVNNGANMLLGPVLDSIRAASILKNLHSLHLRMEKHSANALYLAEKLSALGIKVHYPGLPTHPQHRLIQQIMNPQFGYGGMLVIDMETTEAANALMVAMQEEMVGYLAVSLGYFKTLFSSPGHSTSSEIPPEERQAIGLTDGLVRMSVGLDSDIARTFQRIEKCLKKVGKI
jgi:methionine-gamma-lyase